MTNWNFSAAVYQLGDSAIADQPALVHADQVVSFRQLRRRALGIGAYLDQLGPVSYTHLTLPTKMG